jgi:cbb3-type cytochrome oxidase subunit 3
MEQRPTQKIEPVAVILTILLLSALFGAGLLPNSNFYFAFAFCFFGGLYWLYTGMRKLRAAQASQQQVSWYKQPRILFGIGLLLGVPWYFLRFVTKNSLPAVAEVLLIPSLLLFLAASYFFLKTRQRKAVP